MREQIQLIRVSHPHLGSYEADIVKTGSPMEVPDHIEYVAYLPVSPESAPFTSGERVVIKWGENNLRGRGVISEIGEEAQEGGDQTWRTLKLSITLKEPTLNLRHYPRLFGGISLFYTMLEAVEDAEAGLTQSGSAQELIDDERFSAPLDPLMNFSVSGLSFEADEPLSKSLLLLCAIGLNAESGLVRCLGKVVRCKTKDDRFLIAINFVSPPPELTQQLSEYTLRLQRLETEGDLHEV